MNQTELVIIETQKLEISISANEKASILFNIIKINFDSGNIAENYKNIKEFMNYYVEAIKSLDYGYDNFNYKKIDQLLITLSAEEQISILQYITSISARELPEHDRSWFIEKKHNAEIKHIIKANFYSLYPKAFLLYFGQSVSRLIFILISLLTLTSLILLPSPFKEMEILFVQFEKYSEVKLWNHIFNTFSLFADLDNNLKITPMNWKGLFLIIVGKFFFLTIIINFIYLKLSDKIAQK